MEGGRRHSSTRASRTKHPTSIKQDQLRRTSGADTPRPRPQNRPLDFFLIGCSELLLALGDNAERLSSEAAFAKLCGACPIPASSGKTRRYRLNRGGNRRANTALHRIVVVRMKYHQPTRAYVTRRIAEGKTKSEIMRCLKRHITREIWTRTKHLRHQPNTHQTTTCHL